MTIRAAAVLSLALVLPAQTTHVVQGGGAALQQAINAAAPGDVLDVLPASYTSVIATRGLRIVLRPGAVVTSPIPQTDAVRISAVPAGEALVLTGGTVQGVVIAGCSGAVVCARVTIDGNFGGTQIAIDNCTGPVAFFQGAPATPWPTIGACSIANCRQVSFASCRLPRTTVTASNVAMADVVITPYGGSWPTGNAPSLRIVSGTVAITGGTIHGGVAASLPYRESGVRLEQGELTVTGAANIRETQDPFSPGSVPAIETTGGSVRLDPSVTLVGTPPIGGPAIVTFAVVPSLAIARAPGSTGFQATVAAEPGALAFTLLGLPMPPLALTWGAAWLDPASPIVDVAVMPATGMRTFGSTLAGAPPFLVLVVQSATLSPAGTIAVGAPVRFVWD